MRAALRLRIAWRQLRCAFGRLVTTLVAIALGVALAASILLVNGALLASLEESTDALSGKAALTISARGGVDESAVDVVRATPGVAAAVPLVTGTAFVDDDSGELLTVFGVDLLGDRGVRLSDMYGQDHVQMGDPLTFLNQPDSVIVTREFIERRGLQREGRIELVTPAGARSFTIRGVLDAKGPARALGGNVVIMDLYAAADAFLSEGRISQIDVLIEQDARPDDVGRSLAGRLPQGITVEDAASRKEGVRKLIAGFRLMLDGLALVALLVGFLIAFNRLSTVFVQRLWEVGVTRALGARRGVVTRELLKESLLVGLGGVGLGLTLGILLAQQLMPAVARTAELNFSVPAAPIRVAIRMGPLAVAGAMGLLATFLAALVPAMKAARAPVVEVLRGRGLLQWPATAALRGTVFRLALCGAALGFTTLEWATGCGVFGLLATGMTLVAGCVLIRPVLSSLSRCLEMAWSRCFGTIGRLAVADMVRIPTRTIMTVSVMTAGLAAVVWFGAMERSFEALTTSALGQARRADLIVSSRFAVGSVATLSNDVVDELSRIAGVEAVSAERLVSWHFGGKTLGVCAFDTAHFRNPRFATWMFRGYHLPDALERVARGDAILASPGFARLHRVKVGDQVTVDTPSGSFSSVLAGLAVVSLMSPTGDIVMARDVFQRLWHDSQITRAYVLVAAGAAPDDVRAVIARKMGRQYGLQLFSPAELMDHFTREVQRGFAFTTILQGVTLIVVLLGIADTLTASVLDRTRELGTMRAIGAPRRRVVGLLTLQSVTIGLFGVTFAVLTGLALAVLWGSWTMEAVLGWPLEFHFPVVAVLSTVVLGLSACVIAAILPARHAMRVAPAAALRYE